MSNKARSDLLARMERQAVALGDTSQFERCPYPGEPRWRVDARWVEFECGCRAERWTQLYGATRNDPVIFRDLPEQAVYDYVCSRHEPKMNDIVFLGGYRTFKDWHERRRKLVMGKV